ncbi:MAG: type II toxin-antitoxin system YoeB family toxin [Tannerellaceae bacterium]|nr:type II toxin-antitoxin system YoeB family toxin [Tannerellaceae bacterium]
MNRKHTQEQVRYGKPEVLAGNRKGQWSRRINQRHRLVYKIEEGIVTVEVVSAFGHYGDK